jgi:predicted NUDIX family NTP pyrophosphohydrolase
MTSFTISAGLLMCRGTLGAWEFLLVHPGGPFFARKDAGAWSIPKGITEPNEDPLAAARREFTEETGFPTRDVHYQALGFVEQKPSKRVYAWAFLGDCDPSQIVSNSFSLEWPPHSDKQVAFPEVDRAAFFDAETARRKLLTAQVPLIERALAWLNANKS